MTFRGGVSVRSGGSGLLGTGWSNMRSQADHPEAGDDARPTVQPRAAADGASFQLCGCAAFFCATLPALTVTKVLCLLSVCILGEDGVARSFRVAGGTGFECSRGPRFTVFVEVCVSPPARRGPFF
jgi:hypothetical protein